MRRDYFGQFKRSKIYRKLVISRSSSAPLSVAMTHLFDVSSAPCPRAQKQSVMQQRGIHDNLYSADMVDL
jgi:hypothetical protein